MIVALTRSLGVIADLVKSTPSLNSNENHCTNVIEPVDSVTDKSYFALEPIQDGNVQLENERKEVQKTYRMSELFLDELFHQYDIDKSGFLEKSELKNLLAEMNNGKEPSENEVDWIIQLSCKNKTSVSKKELIFAKRSWQGYVSLPQELLDMFEQFDVDGDGFLQVSEFKEFLRKFAGEEVSEFEANEVLKCGDMTNDNKLGKYELMGAVGAWYISSGREPTPAMALAIAANNRTVSRFHKFFHMFIASTLLPTAYFPYIAAWHSRNSNCTLHLTSLLFVDGTLWLVLTMIMVLKVYWVQMLNCCCGDAVGKVQGDVSRSGRLMYRVAWLLIVTEVLCMMILCLVEGYGAYWALDTALTETKEEYECNVEVETPWDPMLSIKTLSIKFYPSFLEFCHIWFTFNFACNGLCLLFYYCFIAYRFWELYKADRRLNEDQDAVRLRNALSSDSIELRKQSIEDTQVAQSFYGS